MRFTYDLAYFDCQNCEGKIHCAQCAEKTADALTAFGDVTVIEADITRRVLTLEMPPEREDDALDALETARFFVG